MIYQMRQQSPSAEKVSLLRGFTNRSQKKKKAGGGAIFSLCNYFSVTLIRFDLKHIF